MPLVAEPCVIEKLATLPEKEEAAIRATLRQISANFGRPHFHSGLGIRQLRRGLYECRAGLHWRAIFRRDGDSLTVRLLGTHDEVRRFLRGT